MKPRAVFMGIQNGNAIAKVYTDAMRNELKAIVELYPDIIDQSLLETHEDALRETEFIFSTWGMCALTSDEIRRYFPRLKAVFYAAGSVQGFARPFLDNQIMVFSAWAANAIPVAEFTVAQILLANKGIHQSFSRTRSDRSDAMSFSKHFPGNYGTKVGILGYGMIGRKVVELLSPYKLDLYVFDPFLPGEQAAAAGLRKAELDEIFAECQTISNHLANNAETAGLLNKAHFGRMLPHATFINTGRGAQVVERDLIDALRAVRTRTAVLDVTDPEPPLPDSELLQLDNVFLTPHLAGSHEGEIVRMAEYMIEECRRYLEDGTMRYRVTLDMLKTMA